MAVGLIVSNSEPSMDNRYYWFRPSDRKWFELNAAGTEWIEVYDEPYFMTEGDMGGYATVDHTHDHLDDLADIVTLLNNGVTGSKTVQGYTLTFNHGVLTGFEAP